MRRIIGVFFVLGWISLLPGAAGSFAQEEDGKAHVHFFVVPAKSPDGSSTQAAVAKMKEYLLNLAGGYTDLGKSEGGWVDSQGMVFRRKNIAFVVSAPRDISVELKQYISENFGEISPYLLVWEAQEGGRGQAEAS